MTIIASARSGRITFTLPAGSYHLGDVSDEALLKDRFSDLYREIHSVRTGLVSCGERLLVVASIFGTGATWEESLPGQTMSGDRIFTIVPTDMMKPGSFTRRVVITSEAEIAFDVDCEASTITIRTGDRVRKLVDEDASILGRTRGHPLETLAAAFDRVRNGGRWNGTIEAAIAGPPSREEIRLITHAIEFFTGSEVGVIENTDETLFYADGFASQDHLISDVGVRERLEKAIALLA